MTPSVPSRCCLGTTCSTHPALSSDHSSFILISSWMGANSLPPVTHERQVTYDFSLTLTQGPSAHLGNQSEIFPPHIHSLKASSGRFCARLGCSFRAEPHPGQGQTPSLTPCPQPYSPAQPGGSGPSILFPGVQTNFSCFPEPVSLAEPGGAFNRINPSLAAVTKTDFSTKRSICISRALTWFFSVRMFKIS